MKGRYTWMWNAADIVSQQNSILSFCRRHRVNVLFLMFSNSVTDPQYRFFIKAATSLGMYVHALNGDKRWALSSYYPAIQTFLDRIKLYNDASLPEEQFTGVHFDIEPHTLTFSQGDPANWSTQRDQIVSEWMDNVNNYTAFIKQNIQVPVSCALQFSTDTISIADPSFTYLDQWMISKHDKTAVMAYRDFAEGTDGIQYHAQSKIDHAELQKKYNSIIVGVEVCNAGIPEKVSFYEEGREEMYKQLCTLDYNLAGYKTYAGHAIHSLTCWMNSSI